MIGKIAITVITTVGMSAGAWAEVCSDTALYQNMETLGKNMRPMSQAIRGNNLNEASAMLPEMLQAARDAREETPFLFRDGADDSELQDYQSTMDELISQLESLEVALAAEDQQAAAQAMKAMGNTRRDGHRSFQDDACED